MTKTAANEANPWPGTMLALDEIPIEDHRRLCKLGHFAPQTVRNYQIGYRTLLAHQAALDGKLVGSPAQRITAAVLARLADDLVRRLGTATALTQLTTIHSACRHMIPDVNWCLFKAAITRVKTMPDRPKAVGRSHYALPEADVPLSLRPAFAAIEAARHVSPNGGDRGPLASRASMRDDLLRYLGVLRGSGVDLTTLDVAALADKQYLRMFAAKFTNDAAIKRLRSLKSALRSPGPRDGFADVLGELGVGPPPSRALLVHIPEDERRRLEVDLAKDRWDRRANDYKCLADATQVTMWQTLDRYHEVLRKEAPELAATPFLTRDLDAAAAIFEASMLGLETTSVLRAVCSLKSAYDRMLPDSAGDRTKRLGERIRVLKHAVKTADVVLDEAATPEAIKELGLALVNDSWTRLRTLRRVTNPYRNRRQLAERHRDGVVLLLFSSLMLRVANVAVLLLGTYLIYDRQSRLYCVNIPGTLMKTKEDYYQDLPLWLSKIIRRYIRRVRGYIAPLDRHNREFLWLSRRHGALTVSAFRRIVPKYTVRHLEHFPLTPVHTLRL